MSPTDQVYRIKVNRIKFYLAVLVAILVTGCDSGGSSNPSLVANAGPDLSVIEGDQVSLDFISDSINDEVLFEWTQLEGQLVDLQNNHTSLAQFIMPYRETDADLVFQLTLTDANGVSTSDKMIVSAESNFVRANGIKGGQMYDKFWAHETDFTLPNSMLESQAEMDKITSRSNFFRCKQCHGWDRLGAAGAYSNRGPKTSRPNVSNVNLKTFADASTVAEVFESVKFGLYPRRDINTELSSYDPDIDPGIGDTMPDFSQIMTDSQIWDIVKFLKVSAIDTSKLYDISFDSGVYPKRNRTFSNIGKDGDSERGDQIYVEFCGSCHGSDGSEVLVDGDAYTIGGHLRAKPYEDQHKIKFGNPDSDMGNMVDETGDIISDITTTDMVDLFKALSDESKYP